MTVKSYSGGAAATTLSSGIASGTTSIPVADGSTYPSANFNIVIDKGLVGEEKIFISSRSGNTLTVSARGADGTAAAAHSSGASVQHCAFASDFQEANDHVAATAAHGATGAVVGTTNTQTLTNKTLTSPAIGGTTAFSGTQTGAALDAASTLGGVSGTSLAADRAAWTSFTPTWTGSSSNPAIGNGTLEGKYRLTGKTLEVQIAMVAGSTTTFGSGTWRFDLPAGLSAKFTVGIPAVVNSSAIVHQASDLLAVVVPLNGDATKMNVKSVASTSSGALNLVSDTFPASWSSGHSLYLAYRCEVV